MQYSLHRLLQRQIKRHLGISDLPGEWQGLFSAINEAYWQADEDRCRLERTLELTSKELLQANTDLQQALQSVEQQVTERTLALTHANISLESALAQLQQAQIQLVQAEKMSSLGQVAAGIAHEINNPVTFIQGNLHYVQTYMQDLLQLIHQYQRDYPAPTAQVEQLLEGLDIEFVEQDLPKILASMNTGTARITSIVQALHTFSRHDQAELKRIDLQDSLESSILILNSQLQLSGGDRIEVHQSYQHNGKIECYAGQLNQVFMSLMTNAIEALEGCGKFAGRSPCPIDRPHSLSPEELELLQFQTAPQIWIRTQQLDPQTLEIRVIDNGVGIPANIQPHIFDPFFTTKSIGKGTGMGLSTSHQIITKLHRGRLDCRSLAGWGTVFAIRIPLAQSFATQSFATQSFAPADLTRTPSG
jgi:two-component system, NtrC family, sensor kinase